MAEEITGRTTISACMMVKDEESNLPRCLSSLRDLVDEIIVVDTGSSDRTVEIAKEFGARVFHHPWENDFSKHRNQSISYATKEWTFIIDADEEFCSDNLEMFFANLKLVPPAMNAVAITLNDINQQNEVLEFTTARFFRYGCIHYEGIVHNQPVIKDGTGSVLVAGAYVKHYGYDLTPEDMEKKSKRTHSLLMKVIEEEPNNYHTLFYLNQFHAVRHEFKLACEYGEKYLIHKEELKVSGRQNFNLSIYHTMIKSYLKLGDEKSIERAGELVKEGTKEAPGDLDLCMSLVEFGVKTKRTDLMIIGGRQFIITYHALTENPSIKGNRFIHNHHPMSLAFVMFNMIQAHFTEGINCIDEVHKVLEDTKPEFKEGMVKDLEKLFMIFGINDFYKGPDKQQSIVEPDIMKKLNEQYPEIFKNQQSSM